MNNVIQEPTRVTNQTATLIDPVLISSSVTALDSGVLDVPDNISDHHATYIHISFKMAQPPIYKRKVWLYGRADFNKLNNLINQFDWSFIVSNPVNISCKLFTETFLKFIHDCIPHKEVTIRPNDKPWYDSQIRTTTRQRDRQRKHAIKTKKTEDWAKFKSLRNKVNNMKKHAKEQYYNNMEQTIIDSSINNPKLYWKLLRQFIKSNKNAELIPPLKTVLQDGTEQYFFNDSEKANCLNDFFVSISTIDDSNTILPTLLPKSQNVISQIQVQESEIIDVIDLLNPNKAVGEDTISHKVLKAVKSAIAKPLCLLINKSLDECKFPDMWKSSIVMPLFKKGELNLPSNYRPIALLSNIGKIMERVVYKHIYNHLHENDLVYCKQSGFLSGHSTVYQLIDMYHQICQSIDSKQYTCMVFCDVSKAFDRVWHKGLLLKLKQHGISGNLLSWINSYLSNRKQKVLKGLLIQMKKKLQLVCLKVQFWVLYFS